MDDIRAWLNGGREWTAGIALLEKYHRNKFFVKNFRHSSPLANKGKLEYELKKLLGIPLSYLFMKNSRTLPSAKPTPPETEQEKEPELITLAKEEIYKLHTQISIAHRHLFELGESNAADIVAQRKKILDERLPLIKRYEKIYLLKEEYFKTRTLPDELAALLCEDKKGDNQNKFAELSDIELVKKEHALRVSIGKLKNRLQYQSLSKSDHPNPMPPGPLKEKLSARLAAFESDLQTINQFISQRK